MSSDLHLGHLGGTSNESNLYFLILIHFTMMFFLIESLIFTHCLMNAHQCHNIAFALKEQMNFLQVDIFRQNGWSKHKYIGLIWAIYIAIYRLAQPSCNYQSIISSIFK